MSTKRLANHSSYPLHLAENTHVLRLCIDLSCEFFLSQRLAIRLDFGRTRSGECLADAIGCELMSRVAISRISQLTLRQSSLGAWGRHLGQALQYVRDQQLMVSSIPAVRRSLTHVLWIDQLGLWKCRVLHLIVGRLFVVSRARWGCMVRQGHKMGCPLCAPCD